MKLQDSSLFKTRGYIDGKWASARRDAEFAVANPATSEVIARVPDMGEDETREAIMAAKRAWPLWREKTAKERAAILRNWNDRILAAANDLAGIMTMEQGKPFAEALGEVVYAASFIEWFAEEGKRAYGDVIPAGTSDRRIFTIKQSVGVCAAITPWNFPAAMITRKVAPALAVGCTVVVKPAEQTPLTALALVELAERAGVPAGVFNIVTGSAASAPQIGAALTSSSTVRKLSFTGSTEVGRILMAACSPTVKKLSLELGGNAPFIVFDDADLAKAADGAIASKFRNTGQTCVCANRIFVQRKVYDAFLRELLPRVQALKVGNGFDDGVKQGPLIDTAALQKVEAHVADALKKGARVVTGGKRHELGGTFFQPTILADVTPDMQFATEETFGPVAPIFRFDSDAEAIELANSTEFGLASYLFSESITRVMKVAEALEFGIVGVNTGAISSEMGPFGGIKQSGFGREGSKYGLDEYLTVKQVCVGGLA